MGGFFRNLFLHLKHIKIYIIHDKVQVDMIKFNLTPKIIFRKLQKYTLCLERYLLHNICLIYIEFDKKIFLK